MPDPALSIAEAFALHRWRLRSEEEIEREAGDAIALLDRDDRARTLAVARLTEALRYAPYHLAIHDALALHAAKIGDVKACRLHLAARVEVTAKVPGPRSPALAGWPPKQRASILDGLGGDYTDSGQDLSFDPMVPRGATLRWADDRAAQVQRAYRRFLDRAERTHRQGLVEIKLEKTAGNELDLNDESVGSFFSYPALHQLFHEVAPHVEDLRLFCYTQAPWMDEVWIVAGRAYVVRHQTAAYASHAYLHALALEVPDDAGLRDHVVNQWCGMASGCLRHHTDDLARRANLIEQFGPSADLVHDIQKPPAIGRNLVAARHAVERARSLGGGEREAVRAHLASVTQQLDALPEALVAGQSSRSLARWDALARHAEALLARGDFLQALEIVDAGVAIEPAWYEGSSLLRASALDGLGRTGQAREAYADHVARRAGAPYALLTDAGRLVRQGRHEGAELLYRAVFDAPFFYGAAARNGAAACRERAGDLDGARALYASAIAVSTAAASRYPRSGTTRNIEAERDRAARRLAELGA
ncbi:hypothetical protein [Nannocystis sp. SCPEA4]|uniref:hypothetical protein n=1 Tax=Nannocystis sp. SCPEA4 TaxID=2996787 RepID=UPI002270014A|nr:hypothetical protein [Nannocystis sp. SCPEA4]MCY1059001.1 hypothetical protein [Nannocystis sp. SCPEA4]